MIKKTILILFAISSALLALDIGLYLYDFISYRGYYSDVVVFWSWFILSILVILFYWKKLIAKLYLTALIIALILSILPMMLPFWTLVFSMSSFGLKTNKKLNDNYRAQIVGYSVMSKPWLEIIESKGIFEKRIGKYMDFDFEEDGDFRIRDTKEIYLKKETDSTLTIALFRGGNNRIITIDKASGKVLKNDHQ
ncbi:hypothetical protein [Soonwooa sp.]|uniref:hypothetical protein n=1 Tax=Soonwooa sp. TaxID=1938592 RepID=UPI00261D3CB2|nr:hypothetical protein [Soonwooa sp.]